MMLELKMGLCSLVAVVFLSSICLCSLVQARCTRGCDLAFGSFYFEQRNNLTSISQYMNTQISSILQYNRDTIHQDSIQSFVRINVPFSCDCINGEFLGHVFNYNIRSQDTYQLIADERYANLTTAAWIQSFNSYDANRIPVNDTLNVPVNCSCGDGSISKNYGLFVTYPLRSGETLDSVSSAANLSSDLIRSYNPDANFSVVNSLIYIPGRDENGNYPPLRNKSGLSGGAIGGIVVAIVAGVLLLVGCFYYGFYRNKNYEKSSALLNNTQLQLMQSAQGGTSIGGSNASGLPGGASHGLTGITVDKSVEFSYEELSKATDEFSLANKIGEGGFGTVYYAELRGQKAAIKKMARDPLSWSTRVQIALDSARCLEYIHEHTVPVYIHRDIKPANILIDKNFHGKVGDFGLTKLTEVGSTSLPTRVVGTLGYMPPEYARYGDVSPKVDVYAFGVVLYELISAKEAIVKATGGSSAHSKGVVALFDEVLSQPDPKEDDLVKMIDPRLGDNYPLDSVRKMVQLAKAFTHENPQLRPSMRSIVVSLMTLSSS